MGKNLNARPGTGSPVPTSPRSKTPRGDLIYFHEPPESPGEIRRSEGKTQRPLRFKVRLLLDSPRALAWISTLACFAFHRRFATPIGSHLTLVAANKIRLNSCWESAFSLDLELSGDGHCGRNTGVHPTSPGATPPGGPGQASICVAMGRPHARGRDGRRPGCGRVGRGCLAERERARAGRLAAARPAPIY